MKRSIQLVGVVMVAVSTFVFVSASAQAGRIGGPLSVAAIAPAGLSLYYDIPFAAGQRATVSIYGNGKSQLYLLIYDSDGHLIMGSGNLDQRTAAIDVYRSGVFRVEVRNLGVLDNTFTLKTN